MNNDFKPPEPEITNHREIQQSLQLLDRTTSWFWWNTVAMIILLLAAMAALFEPEVSEWFALPRHLDATVIVGVSLVLLLISNCYGLYRQRHFKLLRKRLVEQIQVTITQRKRADKFYGLAILDPLTGLYNRRFGEESLQKESTRAETNRYDLAVIAMDLDYFKPINDEFEHAAGDLVLKEFSRYLRRGIRACDLPIRIGGDEFLVVLPECPRENVRIMLSRLKPFEVMFNRRKIKVSYSRGCAQYQIGDTPQTIIHRADQSLYEEKAARATTAVWP
jgi:diguanylate cyclase (GGDEF)-like protein